jgi:hypothetical protein
MTNHKPNTLVLKRCDCCIGQLPISDYGKSRSGKDGLNPTCRLCNRELGRHKYNIKFGHVHTDELTAGNHRILKLNNMTLLQHLFSNPSASIYGFIPHSNHVYTVSIGPSSSLSTHDCIRLIGQSDDTLSYEYAYDRRDPNVVPMLMTILKQLSIRLERTESDMLDSKQSIYYIGIL